MNDCFSYLYVSGHRCDNTLECENELREVYLGNNIAENATYKKKLLFYLDLAAFFTAQLDRYVLLNFCPVSEFQQSFQATHFTNWKYEMESNDYSGLGVDHGFVCVENSHAKTNRGRYVAVPVISLRSLTLLSEDLFSEASTNVTVFGLMNGRTEQLMNFMDAVKVPLIEKFLQGPEIFIHLMCAKEYGHFNSIMIKSKHDLRDEIAACQNVLDAGN